MNAMDFDDLLVRSVNVLELFQEVRDRYATAFRQSSSTSTRTPTTPSTAGSSCWPPSTATSRSSATTTSASSRARRSRWATASIKPIEEVQVGDEVLSCYGSGDFRPARVTRHHRRRSALGHRDHDARAGAGSSGRPSTCTSPATSAGYTPQHAPDLPDVAPRQGLPRRHDADQPTGRQVRSAASQLRAIQEHADAAWVVSTHDTEPEARAAGDAALAACYGIPTLPFVARPARSVNSLVGDQDADRPICSRASTRSGAARAPATTTGSTSSTRITCRGRFEGRRRNVDGHALRRPARAHADAPRRGRRPRSRGARRRSRSSGLTVRPAKAGSASWRYESCFKDFGDGDRRRRAHPARRLPVTCALRRPARAPARRPGQLAAVHPGRRPSGRAWSMFTEDGGYDVVETRRAVPLDRPVYDLNVEHTHNFVADGLVTHNSIYGFRGADIKNILDFQDDFPDAHVVKLEQNYRSTQTILSAANAVVANNRGRMAKALWTEIGEGDPIKVRELERRARRGALRRRRDRADGRRGRLAVRRSRSSTGPTRSRGCSRTCSCARRSATRSSAARSSTSGPRSGTRSRT